MGRAGARAGELQGTPAIQPLLPADLLCRVMPDGESVTVVVPVFFKGIVEDLEERFPLMLIVLVDLGPRQVGNGLVRRGQSSVSTRLDRYFPVFPRTASALRSTFDLSAALSLPALFCCEARAFASRACALSSTG